MTDKDAFIDAVSTLPWRPIETAPLDGTWVLLFEKYSDVPLIGRYLEDPLKGGFWCASHEHVDAEGGWGGAIVVDSFNEEMFTHWMPLPGPPNAD